MMNWPQKRAAAAASLLKQARALADKKATIPNAFGAVFSAAGGMNCAPSTQV
jgi:hypothetical protein